MTLLLDTTVLIDVLRGRQNRRALFAELVAAGHMLAKRSLNIAEVYAGTRAEEEDRTERFISGLELYPLNGKSIRRAGALKSRLARQGQTLALADMIVAARALEHTLTLMSYVMLLPFVAHILVKPQLGLWLWIAGARQR